MNFNLTRKQAAIQYAVEEVFKKEAKGLAREVEETEDGYSPELWRKMAELGWMGISFPAEYGGGGDFFDLVLVLEEMGKALVPGPFIPSVVCSGHALLEYGSEGQKKEFMPKMTKGRVIIAPAFVEPKFATAQTPVKEEVKFEKGDYVLSGTRAFVPFAHRADWFIHRGETDKGSTLFLVNARGPGVNSTLLKTIGSDRQCEVVFDRVRVPEMNILGEAGKGEEIVNKMTEWGALSECGFILGLLEEVLRMSVEYAKNRVQFGKRIGSFQVIQHQCADMATDVDEVKFLTYQAAWRLSEGHRATREIAMAKARASDACRRVSLLGTKIHGGIGITMEYDMQLYFRRAKAAEMVFGDGDFHRETVARELGL